MIALFDECVQDINRLNVGFWWNLIISEVTEILQKEIKVFEAEEGMKGSLSMCS